jgi:RecA-family ATPase
MNKQVVVEAISRLDIKRGWTVDELETAEWLGIPDGMLGKHLLVEGTVNILAGPAGNGKTWLSLALADKIVSGERFGNLETVQSRVLYISEEMTAAEMRQRMLLLNHSKNYGLRFRFQQGLNLAHWKGMSQLKDLVNLEGKPELIIIDALRDVHSGPESVNDFMAPLIKGLRDEIARNCKSTILLVHHFGKPTEFNGGINGVRGAKAITDIASDVMILDRDEMSRILSFPKVRHGKEPKPLRWNLYEENGKIDVKFDLEPGIEPKEELLSEAEEHERY